MCSTQDRRAIFVLEETFPLFYWEPYKDKGYLDLIPWADQSKKVKKRRHPWFLHLSGKDRHILFWYGWVNKLNTLPPTFSGPSYILASILLSQCCFSIKMETPARGKLELDEEKINQLFTSQFNYIYTVNNSAHFSKYFFLQMLHVIIIMTLGQTLYFIYILENWVVKGLHTLCKVTYLISGKVWTWTLLCCVETFGSHLSHVLAQKASLYTSNFLLVFSRSSCFRNDDKEAF